jgi:small subunit ribosomal protein S6
VRQYELLLVIDPQIDDEQVESVKERVKKFVTDNGGEVAEEDHWGRKKLAYKIGQHAEGNYYLAQLSLDPAPAKAFEGTLNLSEEIIRHMLVLQEK